MRKIYIDKAERVDSYSLLEDVKGSQKPIERFGSLGELEDYLKGDDPYAVALRKRSKRVRVHIFKDNLDWQIIGNLRVELEKMGFGVREVEKPKKEEGQ